MCIENPRSYKVAMFDLERFSHSHHNWCSPAVSQSWDAACIFKMCLLSSSRNGRRDFLNHFWIMSLISKSSNTMRRTLSRSTLLNHPQSWSIKSHKLSYSGCVNTDPCCCWSWAEKLFSARILPSIKHFIATKYVLLTNLVKFTLHSHNTFTQKGCAIFCDTIFVTTTTQTRS